MKYDLRKIMKRAWQLVKETGTTISSGLKKAWKEAKTVTKAKFEKYAVVAKLSNGECRDNGNESNYFYFKLWNKYGKKRIYVNDYKGRRLGYIDCDNNNNVVPVDPQGEFDETVRYFVENYAF